MSFRLCSGEYLPPRLDRELISTDNWSLCNSSLDEVAVAVHRQYLPIPTSRSIDSVYPLYPDFDVTCYGNAAKSVDRGPTLVDCFNHASLETHVFALYGHFYQP